MTAELVLNNALGLAQYIASNQSETDANRFLLTVDTLSLTDWKRAKELLPGTCATNKSTIEGNIREILNVMYTYVMQSSETYGKESLKKETCISLL